MAFVLKVFAFLACLAGGSVSADPNYVLEWNEFKSKYSKVYNSIGEESRRFRVFKQTVDLILETNAKNLSFTVGVNQFADISSEEFTATHMGFKRPTAVWGDLPYLGKHTYSGNPLPDSVDWSAHRAVTPVKTQGGCGACWSFSATGALEGAWKIASNTLLSLSEQQFIDCDTEKDKGCMGGDMESAFAYAKHNAICTEKSYGYKGSSGTCEASNCSVGIPRGGVTGFKDVATKDADALKEAIAQGPVSVGIDADSDVFKSYVSGVFDSMLCGAKLDHAVLAVGYGTDNGKDYWKVKNSWGESYGEKGYIRIARPATPPWQPWIGECGILINPSYPVVKASETERPETAVTSSVDLAGTVVV